MQTVNNGLIKLNVIIYCIGCDYMWNVGKNYECIC